MYVLAIELIVSKWSGCFEGFDSADGILSRCRNVDVVMLGVVFWFVLDVLWWLLGGKLLAL